MSQIHFNSIYIIESHNEKRTGQSLYGTLRLQPISDPGFSPKYKFIASSEDWDMFFKDLINDCQNKKIRPFLHFEIHGSETGITLANNDFVSWENVYNTILPINIAMHNELFITMAVCCGAFFLTGTRFDKPSAFRGVIGSFIPIKVYDLELRYESFYLELLSSLNINSAYEELCNANPDIPSSYRLYSAEFVFAKSYEDYLITDCSEESLKKRENEIVQKIWLRNKDLRMVEYARNNFRKLELKKRTQNYINAHHKFFMIELFSDLHPEISDNIEDLTKWLDYWYYGGNVVVNLDKIQNKIISVDGQSYICGSLWEDGTTLSIIKETDYSLVNVDMSKKVVIEYPNNTLSLIDRRPLGKYGINS